MAQGISEMLYSEEMQQQVAASNNAAKLRVAIPGIIESFDAAKQTVSVQPAITENVQIGEDEAKATPLPVLTDIPICFPRAGGYSITLPVKKGDECLLVFADMCIDGWWQSGGVQDQMETRRHDLSDAFAIIGTTSQPKKISGYSGSALQIRTDNGDIVCELDGEEGAINIVKAKAVMANVSEKMDIKCDGDISFEATGKVTIKGENVDIK